MTRGHQTLLAAVLVAALAATGAATGASAQAPEDEAFVPPPPPTPPPPPPEMFPEEPSARPDAAAAAPAPPPGWPQEFSFQGIGPYSPYSDILPSPAYAPPPAAFPPPVPPYAYPAPSPAQPYSTAPAYAAAPPAAQQLPPAPPPAAPSPMAPLPPAEAAAGPAPMPPREIAAAGEETMGEERNPLFGVISEARAGFLIHDAGVFGGRKEESEDVDLELLFVSPDAFDFMWSPRPIVGVHINDSNDTNQLFGGLIWEWWFWRPLYIDFSFGLAVHDGAIDTEELGKKSLGSRVLFRESLELGWNFYGGHDIGVMLDHISQGNLLGDRNEGLDTLGVHYGYRF